VNTSEIIAPRGEQEKEEETGRRDGGGISRRQRRERKPQSRGTVWHGAGGGREGCNQMLDRPLPLYLFVPQTASFPGYTLITRDEIDGFAATDTVVLTLRSSCYGRYAFSLRFRLRCFFLATRRRYRRLRSRLMPETRFNAHPRHASICGADR
jgi:hypothetical protein